MSCFPYNDSLTRFTLTGLELKNIFSHFMKVENRNSEGECYQVSSKVRAVYNDKADKLESLKIDNIPINEQKKYSICLQGYHFHNSQAYLNISESELLAAAPSKVVSTSAQDIMIEYLRSHQNLISKVEGRLFYR
jgi:5'-nucleotidase